MWWTDEKGKRHYTFQKYTISENWKRPKIDGRRDLSDPLWRLFEKQKSLAQWQEDQKQQLSEEILKELAQRQKQHKQPLDFAKWQEQTKYSEKQKFYNTVTECDDKEDVGAAAEAA